MVQTPGGRRLSFADLGPRSSRVAVYLHGNPGCRLDCAGEQYGQALADVDVRLVAVDRPGVGRSEPVPAFRDEDAPAAVAAVMDQLGVGRFTVLGYSRGGLRALACGARLQDQVTAVSVLSGVGPPDMPGLRSTLKPAARLVSETAVRAPALARAVARNSRRRAARSLDAMKKDWTRLLRSDADRRVLDTAGEGWRRSYLEATYQGTDVTVEEERTWLIAPMGFRLDDVASRVTLWHGEDDHLVPISHGRHLVERLPDARFRPLHGHGHLHTPEVLSRVLGDLVARGFRGS